MKKPFSKIKIGERFLLSGTVHVKVDEDLCREEWSGVGWYISHDEEFPELTICDPEIDKMRKEFA